MERLRRRIVFCWPLITVGCGGFAPRDYGGSAPSRSSAGMAGFSYDAGTGDAGRATSSPPRKDPSSDWGTAASGEGAEANIDSADRPGQGAAASASANGPEGAAGQGGESDVNRGGSGGTNASGAGGGDAHAGAATAGKHSGGSGGVGGSGGLGGRGGTVARGGRAGGPGEAGEGGREGGEGGADHGERALLISEYVEGSGSTKALELRALATSSLEGCEVVIYSNGATSPGNNSRTALDGELSAGDTYVICSKDLMDRLGTLCDRRFGTTFNGDDAVTLECDGVVVDAVGQVGVDPGTAWSVAGMSTLDQTLRRRCSVTDGDAVATDPFDPSLEWQSYALDDVSGLGSPACD